MTPDGLLLFAHFFKRYVEETQNPNVDYTVPARTIDNEALYKDFEKEGLIEKYERPIPESNLKTVETRYRLTERGRAYGAFLCNMSLPVQKWALPQQN